MDILDVILKLHRQTALNEIKWNLISDIPRILNYQTDNYITTCYSYHDNKKKLYFYIYNYRYQNYDGEYERFYNTRNIAFAILSASKEQIIYEDFHVGTELYNLYETIQSQQLKNIL